MADEENNKKTIAITINGKPYDVNDKKMTGAELKALGHVPPAETLYLKREGHKDKPIKDDETVTLKDGDAFESAPDGGVS